MPRAISQQNPWEDASRHFGELVTQMPPWGLTVITFYALDAEHFLKMRFAADSRFEMECSGFGLEEGAPQLSAEKLAEIQRQGWSPPTLMGEVNFHIHWDILAYRIDPVDLVDVSSVAIQTIRTIFGVEQPSYLRIEKVDWDTPPSGPATMIGMQNDAVGQWDVREDQALVSQTEFESSPINPAGTAVRLKDWRGLRFRTREDYVTAACWSCQHRYRIAGEVANTIADQQGAANRMIRWGTRTERLGAIFTPGASGRRIAAGNESARQQQFLSDVLSLAACPRCYSQDVSLYG